MGTATRSVPRALVREVPADSVPVPRHGFVRRWVGILIELSKAKITFAVTFSVATGYILFVGRFDVQMLVPLLGVFLLACGSATINQVQEWRTDAQMTRTRNRPIPSGQVAPRPVWPAGNRR